MNPIITLNVGQERIKFHAYEDSLCKLPFFRAALQGHFKEALEKAIDMPEDDPRKVSALIEFLYTGSYTYTYDIKGVGFREGSEDPVGDLTEGLFHTAVYAIASKYDCSKLVNMALKNFGAVLDELDDIDSLHLWKAAYAEGMRISDVKPDFNLDSYDKKVVTWVNSLFKKYRGEMVTTISEYPELACDLLGIKAGGDL